MEALLYFVAWAFFIFVLMGLGCGRHIISHAYGKKGTGAETADNSSFKWVPPERDTDPVCGKSVLTANAKPSIHDGSVYYFCSRECREVFEAAPEQHLNAPPKDQSIKKMEHLNA